jgi:phage-related protein
VGELKLIIITEVNTFIYSLPEDDQAKIKSSLTALENRSFDSIYVKSLTKELQELRVRKYRLIFFIHESRVYIVRIFIKKTQKTPRKEIEMAERYYKFFTN